MKQSKIVFLVAICMVIIGLIPATAFAKAKQKLTKAQVEQIFKTLEAKPELRTQEVSNALDLIVKTMDEVKKDKSISKAARNGIEDLLGCNKYYAMFANTRDLISMSWSYATSGNQSAQIDKGAQLAFDLIEFSAAWWLCQISYYFGKSRYRTGEYL